MKTTLIAAAALGLCAAVLTPAAQAHWPMSYDHVPAEYRAYATSTGLPWHNAYYHAAFGEPYALVVPPTAEFQTNYGWGVSGTRVSPIYHQFARPFPGYGYGGGAPYGNGFLHTPAMPSDTTQFGVYYIRGPW